MDGPRLSRLIPVDILLILIPLSIVLIGLAAAAFVWAARDGQFEALDEAPQLPPDEPPAG